MIEVQRDGDLFTIKFTKKEVSERFLQKILRGFEIERILQKSQLTAEQAWQLSEEIKEKWWLENKGWILKKTAEQVK